MIGAFRSHESPMIQFWNLAPTAAMTSASAACIKAPPSLIAFFILYPQLLLAFLKTANILDMASLALSQKCIGSLP